MKLSTFLLPAALLTGATPLTGCRSEITDTADSECQALEPGESTEEGRLSGIFLLGDWANRVAEVLEMEGLFFQITPLNGSEPCYEGEIYPWTIPTLNSRLTARFNFGRPLDSTVFSVRVDYPLQVDEAFEKGYVDNAGQSYEAWQLACFELDSNLRPPGNYAYVFDENPHSQGDLLSFDYFESGNNCDIAFQAIQ